MCPTKLSALIPRTTATSRSPLFPSQLSRRVAQLLPKLRYLHAMLRGLPPTDENHGNIRPVALLQQRIFIDIYLSQGRPEFSQKRCNLDLSFLAQVTAGPCVQRDFARPRLRKPLILWVFAHGFGFEYFWNGPECG
jgi:hypothetical protein